jgi:hypothetical protein
MRTFLEKVAPEIYITYATYFCKAEVSRALKSCTAARTNSPSFFVASCDGPCITKQNVSSQKTKVGKLQMIEIPVQNMHQILSVQAL